mmetsp:Transcript_18178/g.37892  ORF Transcript_18178/g.37892 Transcript_18178/m.37892 type:complete len:307 (-) Transcript_18178:616-1536(-)
MVDMRRDCRFCMSRGVSCTCIDLVYNRCILGRLSQIASFDTLINTVRGSATYEPGWMRVSGSVERAFRTKSSCQFGRDAPDLDRVYSQLVVFLQNYGPRRAVPIQQESRDRDGEGSQNLSKPSGQPFTALGTDRDPCNVDLQFPPPILQDSNWDKHPNDCSLNSCSQDAELAPELVSSTTTVASVPRTIQELIATKEEVTSFKMEEGDADRLSQEDARQRGRNNRPSSSRSAGSERENHEDRKYRCETCGQRFLRQGHLTNHEMNVHLRIKAFSCDYCEKKFSSKSNTTRHIMRFHRHVQTRGHER